MGLIDSYCGGRRKALRSAHPDLWEEIFDAVAAKGLHLTIKKVPGHAAESSSPLPPDLEPFQLVGNAVADVFAQRGAVCHEVSAVHVREYQEIHDKAAAVLRRILSIVELCSSLPVPAERVTQKVRAERMTVRKAILKTKHRLAPLGRRFRCTRCFGAVAAGQGKIQWLLNACPGLLGDAFALGGPHSSHRIVSGADFGDHGLVWCQACGAWGRTALRSLRRRCPGTAHWGFPQAHPSTAAARPFAGGFFAAGLQRLRLGSRRRAGR